MLPEQSLVVGFGIDVDRNRPVELDKAHAVPVPFDERPSASVSGKRQEFSVVGSPKYHRTPVLSLP